MKNNNLSNQNQIKKTEEIKEMNQQKQMQNTAVSEENAAIDQSVFTDNFKAEQSVEQAAEQAAVAAATASATTRDLNSSEEAVRLTRRTFELCGGASMAVNLYDGSNSTIMPIASDLGLNIPIGLTFTFNRNMGNLFFGGLWSNLDESLKKKSNGDYTHVDAVCGVHTLSPADTVTENHLIDGSLKKIFGGTRGDLRSIEDFYGHTVTIERDSSRKINTVTDNQGHTVSFGYISGKISTITDAYGKVTSFSFNDTGAVITYPNGETLTVTIVNSRTLTKIDSSEEGIITEITYDSSYRTTNINYKNTFIYLGHGSAYPGTGTMSTTQILYKRDRTDIVLGDDYGTNHIYKFATDGNLSEYYVIQNSVVVNAMKFDYVLRQKDNVYYARKSSLRKTAYSDFSFATEEKEEKTFDEQNRAKKTIVSKLINTNTIQKAETDYAYGVMGLAIKETTKVETTYPNGTTQTYTLIKDNTYTGKGQLLQTESYVSSELATKGKTVVKYTYDEQGNMTEMCSYNSLDPTVKFYTKRDYDEKNRLKYAWTQKGEGCTQYDYDDENGGRLKSVTLPGGGKLVYGYDSKGNVSSISQTTADGQVNKIENGYTQALLTQAKSADTEVKYQYNYRRELMRATATSGEYVDVSKGHILIDDDYVDPIQGKVRRDTLTYLNGDIEAVEYDVWGNPVATKFNGEHMTHTEYNADGTVKKHYVKNGGGVVSPKYDSMGRLTDYGANETFTYNKDGQLDKHNVHGLSYKYTYSDDYAKELKNIGVSDMTVYLMKDKQGRYAGKEVRRNGIVMSAEKITYTQVGNNSTNLPKTESYFITANGARTADGVVEYSHNARDYITDVKDGNGVVITHYVYDNIGRLVREDNNALGKTTVFTYDNNGNILTKKEASYTQIPTAAVGGTTKTYTYDSSKKDRMTSFGGESCVYDSMGRPTTYRGKTVTWERGRFVSSIGSTTFITDGAGKRVKKGDISFTYDCEGNLRSQSNGFTFLYDHTGVFGFKYDVSTYYYRKNVLGDIVAILDKDGKVMVKYVYDAWGNHKVLDASGSVITSATHIGNINPFRYRGYYYDTETGLYYLKARYYDPEVGRFISADDASSGNPNHVNGMNLYTYCCNNPVMCKQFVAHSGGNMNDCYPHNAKGKIDPVTGMLKSYSLGLNSVYGTAFRGKYFFGHIKATLLHADWSAGLDMQDRLLIGVFGEFSAIKLDGQIGVGVDELNLSLVGRADILTASGMAGLVIDPGKHKYFLGFDASVTALSLQAGTRVNIFGFQLEGGVTLDVGTIGGGFGIGYDKGKIKFCGGFKYGIGYGFYVVIDISKFLH